MDMDVAGDFIAMAAQLVYIKSRMLLPQREETPGEDDPRAELVDMLLEYQRFRQATAFFREKGEEGADMLTKAPEPLGDAPREVHGVPNDLIRAANRLLRRVSRRLFDGARSRSEIVATFLAVLELSRTHRIRLHGEGEDIELTLNDEKGSETRDTTGEHA